MRHLATALVPALVLGLAACQGPAGPGPGASGGGDKRAAATTPGVARIGDTADDGGTRSGEHLRISLRGYVDPAIGIRTARGAARGLTGPAADGPVRRPAAGTRWVGVDLAVVNVGGTAHETPVTRAWVVDDRGRSHRAVPAGELTTGPPLPAGRLTVGEHRTGWLVFELPHGSRPVRLHCETASAEHRWTLQSP
ncbi:DUF4352 domain-containing protein [Streptomyces sp. t39]|uniref:DUF4352 domain-containing protein n=1 Tax=Streptomyces sp. t39 TaxID=1828156 RepID=UPI0011CDDC2A|nr:DUF4352 domain-containing protein [Streptomyces sp. t39]TXS56657.1 DUF4352 domain-containing protein [Streptomyces sp. t39]